MNASGMYECFGLNIGEAMAVGAFPVVHDLPRADRPWPQERKFARVDQAGEPVSDSLAVL
jgi:hypothetical protein